MIRRNVANQTLTLPPLLTTADGTPVDLGAAVRVKLDAGSWTAGGGTPVYGEDGCWDYTPTQAETNCTILKVKISKTGATAVVLNLVTTGADTSAVALGANTTAPDNAGIASTLAQATNAATSAANIQTRIPAALDSGRMIAKAESVTGTVTLATSQPNYAPAKAGDAMTLTSGERAAVANEVEAQIIDDTDSERVLQAIVDKIAAANPSLDDLTLGAIASAVRTELATELARIDAAITTRSSQASVDVVDDFVDTEIGTLLTRTDNIQSRLPAALVDGRIDSNVSRWRGTQPGNVDSNGFVPGNVASINGSTDRATTLATAMDQNYIETIVNRIGAFAGSGVNSVLGFLRAIMRSDATLPSDVGGTFAAATDSLQAIRDRGDVEWITGSGSGGVTGDNEIAVTITDSDTSEPIEGAIVRYYRTGQAGGGTATVDSDGEVIVGLNSATWKWIASAAGYLSKTGTLIVDDDGAHDIELDAVLITPSTDPNTCNMGIMVRNQRGQAVSGATVTATLNKTSSFAEGLILGPPLTATTNGSGIATLPLLWASSFTRGDGAYSVTATKDGYTAKATILAPDEASDLYEITL